MHKHERKTRGTTSYVLFHKLSTLSSALSSPIIAIPPHVFLVFLTFSFSFSSSSSMLLSCHPIASLTLCIFKVSCVRCNNRWCHFFHINDRDLTQSRHTPEHAGKKHISKGTPHVSQTLLKMRLMFWRVLTTFIQNCEHVLWRVDNHF